MEYQIPFNRMNIYNSLYYVIINTQYLFIYNFNLTYFLYLTDKLLLNSSFQTISVNISGYHDNKNYIYT